MRLPASLAVFVARRHAPPEPPATRDHSSLSAMPAAVAPPRAPHEHRTQRSSDRAVAPATRGLGERGIRRPHASALVARPRTAWEGPPVPFCSRPRPAVRRPILFDVAVPSRGDVRIHRRGAGQSPPPAGSAARQGGEAHSGRLATGREPPLARLARLSAGSPSPRSAGGVCSSGQHPRARRSLPQRPPRCATRRARADHRSHPLPVSRVGCDRRGGT